MDDLKLIKKHYGENMMHLCRELFPTILEKEGLLFNLLSKKFSYNRDLCSDIINSNKQSQFKNLIFEQLNTKKEHRVTITKTPKELLSEAGYNLYECKTEEEIQYFKKYYRCGEELCTFNGGRLKRCYVFFAVKKNVDEIKREDFENPKREDLYGTSVISIQFTRDKLNTLSIKNRYNHTVNNPDATFSNNLDNIIPGLKESFNKYYNLMCKSSKTSFDLRNYVCSSTGKYYKYNYEINNIYYCPDNIIIDNFEEKKYDKEKYIVLDKFILDLVNKTIIDYENKDSFPNSISKINKIEIKKEKDIKKVIINGRIVIILDKQNRIIKYMNNIVENIDNDFLSYNTILSFIELSNVKTIGNNFLSYNKEVKKVYFPQLERVADEFLKENRQIKLVELPNIREIGKNFLFRNKSLKKIDFPNLEKIGKNFIDNNEVINKINLPNLKYMEEGFLYQNQELIELNLPKLKHISRFMHFNQKIELLNIPLVEEIEDSFMHYNESLKKLIAINLKKVGNNFLSSNQSLEELIIPNLVYTGDNFLYSSVYLEKIEIPNLEKIGKIFLYRNTCLRDVEFLYLKKLEEGFLKNNYYLDTLYLPNIDKRSYDKSRGKFKLLMRQSRNAHIKK